jgi:nucleoside 2-deoxyribosyltransferase
MSTEKRKRSDPIKLYLAGKISQNDWRNQLVIGLSTLPGHEWRDTESLSMRNSYYAYVGPFFVSCDHGCAHGTNQHGATESCGDGEDLRGPISHDEVIGKSFQGIHTCDLFIVWADADFLSAYGSIAEIGMAFALGKPIVIIRKAGLDAKINSAWYSLGCSYLTLESKDPVTAIDALLRTMARISDVKEAIRFISKSQRLLAEMHFDFVGPTKWEPEPARVELLQTTPALIPPTTKTKAGAYEIETTVSVAEEQKLDRKN